MASAASSNEAPARAAPRACDAMQPSHCLLTEMPNAMSSLCLVDRTPSPRAALWVWANPS